MRSATILDFKFPDVLIKKIMKDRVLSNELRNRYAPGKDTFYFVHYSPEINAIMREFTGFEKARWNVFITENAAPHKDETCENHTFGIILKGNHQLFTGNYRPVGDLIAGSCYLLNNQKMHGAKPNEKAEKGEQLIFAAYDFDAYDMKEAESIVKAHVKQI